MDVALAPPVELLPARDFMRRKMVTIGLEKVFYFWEDGPSRAAEWARMRYGRDAAVLRATIELGECLNLLDPTHFEGLSLAYEATIRRCNVLGLPIPINVRKRHELDYLVVENYCEDFAALGGEPFQTVRGCFPEGPPIYSGSRILRETHIQIAVRDARCIGEVIVVN